MHCISAVFALNLSLLLLHEMDAVRTKEWRMFLILKSMREETAYIVFSIFHLPLYFCLIFILSQMMTPNYAFIYLIIDVLLIAHTAVHFFFRRHTANGFTSVYSNALIYSMGFLAGFHLIMK